MRALVPLLLLLAGVAGYHAYIHVQWRAEVRRRRAERDRLRARFRAGRVWPISIEEAQPRGRAHRLQAVRRAPTTSDFRR